MGNMRVGTHLLAFCLLTVAASVRAEVTAKELYELLVQLDDKRVLQLKQGRPDTVMSETGPKIEKAKSQLSALAESGDRDGALYWAHVLSSYCKRTPSGVPNIDRFMEGSCRASPDWYRKAAEKGSYMAAAYLADAYRDGQGIDSSDLAAVDWYYKAARLALEDSYRDFALKMLEEMAKLVPNHVFVRDLKSRLYPKERDNQRRRSPAQKPKIM